MMVENGLKKVTQRLGGVLAAVLLLGVGVGASASGALSPFPDEQMDGQASLTVHKLSLEERTGEAGVGLPVSGFDSASYIDGVTFQIRKIEGIDLTVQAGWLAAAELSESFESGPTAQAITAQYGLGAPVSLTTGQSGQGTGQAHFSGLDLGVYLVEETITPAGVIGSDPFVVTIPLTHPVERDSWLYDVHVYPKNEKVTAEKSIDDSAAVIGGDHVKYTITAPVPTVVKSDFYLVRDELPIQTELVAQSVQVSLTSGTALQQGPSGHYVLKIDGQVVEVELTQLGLDVAYEAAMGSAAKLVVQFDAKIRPNFGGSPTGEFINSAQIFPNSPSWENDSAIRPSVETRWGSISVMKVNAEKSEQALAGATFQVWHGPVNDFSQAQPIRENQADTSSQIRQWTSNANGQIDIPALRYSGWANGQSVTPQDPSYRYYWLVETVAPQGYTLLSEPVAFTVDSESATKHMIVHNVPENVTPPRPPLVNTGVMLGLLLPLAGTLVLGGTTAVILRRKKETTQG